MYNFQKSMVLVPWEFLQLVILAIYKYVQVLLGKQS